MKNNVAQELIDFIHKSPSTFHVIKTLKEEFEKAGFEELNLEDKWNLKRGKKYYTTRNDSSLFAFITGMGEPENEGFKIISAHSDSPTFKLKPSPEMKVENSN